MRNGPVKDVALDSADSGYHSIYMLQIALQKWINAKVYPSAKPKTAATKKAEAKPAQLTEREKKINAMCDWATKIAKSGKYKYKKWKNGKANTHKCPICHPGSGNGWNCIGFAFAVWHHGGGLRTNCSCGVVTNGQSEKLLTLPMAEALKLARRLIGTDKIKIIRNGGKAIPLSMLQKGDILLMYKGRKYYHTAFYMGGGRYADSSKTHKPNIKAGMNLSAKRKSHTKVAIRYTG